MKVHAITNPESTSALRMNIHTNSNYRSILDEPKVEATEGALCPVPKGPIKLPRREYSDGTNKSSDIYPILEETEHTHINSGNGTNYESRTKPAKSGHDSKATEESARIVNPVKTMSGVRSIG